MSPQGPNAGNQAAANGLEPLTTDEWVEALMSTVKEMLSELDS